MPAEQLVPIGQVAGDVVNLGDALTIGCIVLPPEVERIHVEVLAVKIDTLSSDQLADVVGQPLASLRIA